MELHTNLAKKKKLENFVKKYRVLSFTFLRIENKVNNKIQFPIFILSF